MREEEVLTCSECSTSPWKNHCCTCEPCVVKREKRQYNAGLEAAAKLTEEWAPGTAKEIRNMKKEVP